MAHFISLMNLSFFLECQSISISHSGNTYPSSRPLDCNGSRVPDCNNAIKCNCIFLFFGRDSDTVHKEIRYLDSLNPSGRDICVVAHIQQNIVNFKIIIAITDKPIDLQKIYQNERSEMLCDSDRKLALYCWK